jgi:hypothetical protein
MEVLEGAAYPCSTSEWSRARGDTERIFSTRKPKQKLTWT